MTEETHAARLNRRGFSVVARAIAESDGDCLARELERLEAGRAGSRTLLDHPWCIDVASRLRVIPEIADALPLDPVATQCTLFAKTLLSNWLVALHQDLSIPVRERIANADCRGWSEKEGDRKSVV